MRYLPWRICNPICNRMRLPVIVLLLAFLVALPLVASGSGKSGEGSFLIVSDLHFDPFADPSLVNRLASADYRQWEQILESSGRSGMGSYGRDAPYPLLKSALEAMRDRDPAPDLILFGGDFLAHDFRGQYDKYAHDKSDAAYRLFVEKTIRFLALMFDSRFPSVPIMPTLGNNDADCGDYGVAPGGAFLKMFADVWAPLVARGGSPAPFLDTFPVGGYYNVANPAIKGYRIIALNANLFSPKARNCGPDGDDHGTEELGWLDWNLYRTRLGNGKAWVIYHEPVGVDVYSSLTGGGICHGKVTMMLKDNYGAMLLQTLEKNARVVSASFAGHTHMDDFRLDLKGGEPKFFTHITPSVSPVFGNNPAFQRFIFDRDSGTIRDFSTYVLANFATARNVSDARWEMEYDFAKTYGRKEYTTAALNSLYAELLEQKALRDSFIRYYASGTGGITTGENLKALLCGIGNMDADSFAACYCSEK